ncbi:hypothetical protein [Rhabdaerophilum calidifontis]|uniref:hypothetical protein n=1 Tax=Rhabdaerophilum calidifontis TaxID=2604328 RepID=UPI0012389AB2|nr:hypothetical protein [Rhabdaerophilum calidifontis]
MRGGKALLGLVTLVAFGGIAGAQAPRAALPAALAPPSAAAPGWSLSLALVPGWSSNPEEAPGRRKGDAFLGLEAGLSRSWQLRAGTSLTLTGAAMSELYRETPRAGFNRALAGISLGQALWGGTLTLGAGARTTLNQRLTAHDSASQNLSLGFSRSFGLGSGLTLIPSLGLSRRFYQNGSKNDWGARASLALVHRRGPLSLRIGGGIGWLLEDNTPILPRIRDRSFTLSAGLAYEWAPGRELSLRTSFTRGFSSYAPNRYRALTLAPQAAATLRF